MDNAEAELESFRQQWRQEVSARSQAQPSISSSSQAHHTSAPLRQSTRRSAPPPVPLESHDGDPRQHDIFEPVEYSGLGEKEPGRRVGDMHEPPKSREPRSALEHYEKAVEEETQGKLGDSMHLYRRAFKLDANVQEKFKDKHYPPGSYVPPRAPPIQPTSSEAASIVPMPTIPTLISEFANLSILGEPPPSDLSPAPPCPIAHVPHEIMAEILIQVAIADVASLGRLAQVCKRFAYLVATEDRIWKRITRGSEFGFGAQHYRYACTVEGRPLEFDEFGGRLLQDTYSEPEDLGNPERNEGSQPLRIVDVPLSSGYHSYRQMFQTRPRIRFNGCYISTVNYFRPGAASQSTWGNPCIIVTYYRYLRLFRDGTAISLLTTVDPTNVVPYLSKENMHEYVPGSTLPNAVMKDALAGRWRLSGPEFSQVWPPPRPKVFFNEEGELIDIPDDLDDEFDAEPEGTLHIETEGVIPKYIWKMAFSIASAGRKTGVRNNKLNWKGYWSYNKLTDDWGKFELKNDGPFYWSRVKRWT